MTSRDVIAHSLNFAMHNDTGWQNRGSSKNSPALHRAPSVPRVVLDVAIDQAWSARRALCVVIVLDTVH